MSLLPRRVLPVLMYHRFGACTGGDPELWISMEQFAAQLRWLKSSGYRTLCLAEAHEFLSAQQVPQRTVLLTIDDGFATDLERAAEELEREGARAAAFVPAGLLGESVNLSHPSGETEMTSAGTIADRQDLRRWIDRGFDVGCHSMTHLDLTTLAPEELRREVTQSRDQLSAALNHPIDDFCYPFAHHDAASRQAVAAAGYRTGYAGEPPTDDLMAIPRMMIYPRDDVARFRRKASGFYFWISALHQKLRRFMRN